MVKQGLNHSEIAKILKIHRTTVSRKLKKYDIRYSNNNFTYVNRNTNCSLCHNDLGSNKNNRSRCKACTTRIRRYRIKKKCVDYKGGSCIKCGYNDHLAALEFHHTEKNKDFTIAGCNSKNWEIIKLELDKCVILCSNCHRIQHSKYDDVSLIKHVENCDENKYVCNCKF